MSNTLVEQPVPPLPPGVDGRPVGGRWRPTLGPPELWRDPRMRDALAVRDVAAVYRMLQARGVAQRVIAAATAQSQSEIAEILAGRRVQSYDLLTRICDGLGVPRGWMGLATTDDPPPCRSRSSAPPARWRTLP